MTHFLSSRWTPYLANLHPARPGVKGDTSRSQPEVSSHLDRHRCRPEAAAVVCLRHLNTSPRSLSRRGQADLPHSVLDCHPRDHCPRHHHYPSPADNLSALNAQTSIGAPWLASTSALDFVLVNVAILLITAHTLARLTVSPKGPLDMGNEGSAPSSQDSTPISEYPSLYSIHSRVRSSVESTRAPSPMEAPEPDLSHLTSEEVAQIRSVMERAKNMQQEETTRARKLEDSIDYATKVEREASLSELVEAEAALCPVCNKTELTLNQDGSRSSMNVCVDCEKMTCTRCGSYHTSLVTRIQEWVCVVCDKQRRLMMTTGMWYHGYQPETEVTVEKQGGPQVERARGPDSHMTSSMDTSMTSSLSQTSSKGSKDSRDSKESRADSEHTGGTRNSWEGSRCGGDSGLSLELSSLSAASSQNSELARQVYEQSRVKGILMYMMGPCGPGANLTKSESDEFSDRTSDLDFDELASERSRPDGGSSTDESNRDAVVASLSHKQSKRQKHRPKSLNLSRSHSHTSSDEEDGSGGSDKKGDTWSTDKQEPPARPKAASSAGHVGPESKASSSADGHKHKKPQPSSDLGAKVTSRDLASLQDLIDSHAVNSPTPPRSPSWREGLESPPFSPRRRDSYPGKRRGSLSPKEKSNHFTYADISPPSRQPSVDELYGDSSHPSSLDNGVAGSHAAQKPSPLSPDEMKDSFVSTAGETLVFDLPPTRARVPVSCPQPHHSDLYSLPHSAPVMDLATYAATIANSTASLTSMSVSPTNLLPHPSQPPVGEPLSPDSAESVDSRSSSPVSPGYYDNAPQSADEVEEVELADPSAKSIDLQGTKRQKVRPPSTDWSPVIDLSPILDVSPSIEEAEQEDMLAKQMEELERQRSRDEIADDEYDEDDEYGRDGGQELFEGKPFGSGKRAPLAAIPRIPPPPSTKRLKQQLNEEHVDEEEDDNDELDALEEVSPYTYSSGLKRCGNFEDISQLGSDNSLIKSTSELLASDRLDEDSDTSDPPSDFPFFSCTTQSQTLAHSGATTITSISTLQAPGKQAPGKLLEDPLADEQGGRRLKNLESLITDEIHKIAEGMENIAKRGAMDVKPIPPPKPKRRLPDPEILISPPPAKVITEAPDRRHLPAIKTEDVSQQSSSKDSSLDEAVTGKYLSRQDSTEKYLSRQDSTEKYLSRQDSTEKYLSRQDSTEKRKAKDLKAKPSPILVQHIESEEQSVSPHYKVMESPPTPEVKSMKREFSDSTSVSPSSSPDQDVYAFPSPVTPPDSDSSPPKPHSPSTDLEDDASVLPPDGGALYRSASPYDNARPSHKPRRTVPTVDNLPKVGPFLRQDPPPPPSTTSSIKPETMMKPPISPRRSIRKFGGQRVEGGSSPPYENVKGLTTQEYLHEQEQLGDGSSLFQGLTKSSQYLVHQADIVAYPLVGEFPPRPRSSSAPSTDMQQRQRPEPAARPRPASVDLPQGEPAARPRPASVDLPQGEPAEKPTSVRDKIRAFEEPPVAKKRITSKPKDTPPPRPEPKEETRRQSNVMKDKRTDSGSSTSSSGSSAKTSSSRSSSDAGRSQVKDKDGKKVRRKLPPIPVGEDPVLVPKSKMKRTKPPTMKRGNGMDHDDVVPPTATDSRRVQYQSSRSSSDSEGYFVGPSNRPGAGLTRDSDESMNEDDIEVAKLTTLRDRDSEVAKTLRDRDSEVAKTLRDRDNEVAKTLRDRAVSPKRKTLLVDVGKSKSLDSGEARVRSEAAEAARVKPPIQRTASLGYGPKDETDEIIDSLISIYGIPCTEAMKSLKKRLQEELRRVTRDRKRKLEELEEIRALQMQIGALKLESDAYARSRAYAGKRSPAQHMMMDSQLDSRKRGSAGPSPSLTPRSSPQVTPRRQRHKRQSSDPMIAKFSPIKEDKDIEGDFQTRVHEPPDHRTIKYHTDDSSQSGISDCESTRSEPVREARYSKVEPSDYSRGVFYAPKGSHGGSAERLQYSSYEQSRYDRTQLLSGSRSEQQLSSRTTPSVFYLDDEDAKAREEKKAMLQYEIMKRKQQLEETARLKNELLKLARARQNLAHSYDDIPRQYVTPASPRRSVPRGIIKPIDDESHLVLDHRSESGRRSQDHSRDRSRERSMERRSDSDRHLSSFRDDVLDSMVMSDHRYHEQRRRHHSPHQAPAQDAKDVSNYSSSEYLAHKQESASRRYMDEPAQYGSQGWAASDYTCEGLASTQAYSQPALNKRVDSSQSLAVARRPSAKKEAGIVSSITLPNIYADRGERDFRPSYREATFASTSISDTDGSPASDITPAMPLLDDVKAKSRTIIRNIGSGSRPVSAEFCAGDVEDLLNAMYRVESDNSVDADEPIMKHMTEGGVTILKQIDRKRRPAPLEPHRYSYPVKRILVTRDAKDKSITGNGLGMKIVGGKLIPGTSDFGAFVTAIYPIIVDQLHGELDVGDQVLEWNGIHLTGLSADEVQDIISRTNGEIEMVVRAQVMPAALTDLVAQPESCRSSYDNLNLPSFEEESVKELHLQRQRAGRVPSTNHKRVEPPPPANHKHVEPPPPANHKSVEPPQPANRQGVDPRQLAAQLEGIREAASPAENSPSSSHQDVATPSVSSRCSTPSSDPTSTSSDRQQHVASPLAAGGGDKTDRHTDRPNRHRRRRRQSPNQENTQHQKSHHTQRQTQHQPAVQLKHPHQPATSPPHQPASHPHHHHHSTPHQHQSNRHQHHSVAQQPITQHQQQPTTHHPATHQHHPTIHQHHPTTHQHQPSARHHSTTHQQQPTTQHQQQPTTQQQHQPTTQQPHQTTQHHPTTKHQQQPTTQQHQPTTQPQHEQSQSPQHHYQQTTQPHHQHQSATLPHHQPTIPAHHQHHTATPLHQQPPTQPHRQQHQVQPAPKPQQTSQQPTPAPHSDKDALPVDRPLPSRRKGERSKQQEVLVQPVSSCQEKPPLAPVAIADQPEDGTCSSPALNDRLRASPPLDTRNSMKTRASRRSKDHSVISLKSPLEAEKGEDFGLGEVQLQISHDDFDNTLNIHIIQARHLRPRDLNGLSDPFVKLYLLPGRGQENKRRTKHIARTLNPEWHQTVMFQDVARLELQNKVLEITVWDYDRFKTNDFLGELIIELREFAFLDNKPHWYPLKEHVSIQSFELPKSTVAPPKSADNGRSQSKSPRHGKKHGVSSLLLDPVEKEGAESIRRKSLGNLPGNGANETLAVRQISSATSSPIPARRPRGGKSPTKIKSNGLLHR